MTAHSGKIIGTILVVEDEEEVRDVAVEMFVNEDFHVLVAADATTAYQVFESHPEIDLVFSDLILPGGTTGIDLAKRILARKADSLIILVTGYGEKGSATQASIVNTRNMYFIPKPYDITRIPSLARSMLNNRATSKIFS